MMSCKTVALTLSTGNLSTAPLVRRMSVRLHLAMCRSCRAFGRQLWALGELARRISRTYEHEPADDFEGQITRKLVERR